VFVQAKDAVNGETVKPRQILSEMSSQIFTRAQAIQEIEIECRLWAEGCQSEGTTTSTRKTKPTSKIIGDKETKRKLYSRKETISEMQSRRDRT